MENFYQIDISKNFKINIPAEAFFLDDELIDIHKLNESIWPMHKIPEFYYHLLKNRLKYLKSSIKYTLQTHSDRFKEYIINSNIIFEKNHKALVKYYRDIIFQIKSQDSHHISNRLSSFLKKELLKIDGIDLNMLIPSTVLSIAHRADNVYLKILSLERNKLSFVIIEKNFIEKLTDINDLEIWHATRFNNDISSVANNLEYKLDYFHKKLYKEIIDKIIEINDKIYLKALILTNHDNPYALYVGDYDGIRKRGIATDFYSNTLPEFAKNLGYRFIVGLNSNKNIGFFIDKLNRYPIEALDEDYQHLFFQEYVNDKFFTIQFLYEEDKIKFLKK